MLSSGNSYQVNPGTTSTGQVIERLHHGFIVSVIDPSHNKKPSGLAITFENIGKLICHELNRASMYVSFSIMDWVIMMWRFDNIKQSIIVCTVKMLAQRFRNPRLQSEASAKVFPMVPIGLLAMVLTGIIIQANSQIRKVHTNKGSGSGRSQSNVWGIN